MSLDQLKDILLGMTLYRQLRHSVVPHIVLANLANLSQEPDSGPVAEVVHRDQAGESIDTDTLRKPERGSESVTILPEFKIGPEVSTWSMKDSEFIQQIGLRPPEQAVMASAPDDPLVGQTGIDQSVFRVVGAFLNRPEAAEALQGMRVEEKALWIFLYAWVATMQESVTITSESEAEAVEAHSRSVESVGMDDIAGINVVREQQKPQIRSERAAIGHFAFAYILWMLMAFARSGPNSSVNEASSTDRDEYPPEQPERQVGMESYVRPWILLAIIWYLSMIRESGSKSTTRTSSKRKRQNTKSTQQVVSGIPNQGVVYLG